MILKVNKCFISALYNEMQLKMCGFREKKRWRTVTFGNCVGMPTFLYYDHTVNRDIGIYIVGKLEETLRGTRCEDVG